MPILVQVSKTLSKLEIEISIYVLEECCAGLGGSPSVFKRGYHCYTIILHEKCPASNRKDCFFKKKTKKCGLSRLTCYQHTSLNKKS